MTYRDPTGIDRRAPVDLFPDWLAGEEVEPVRVRDRDPAFHRRKS